MQRYANAFPALSCVAVDNCIAAMTFNAFDGFGASCVCVYVCGVPFQPFPLVYALLNENNQSIQRIRPSKYVFCTWLLVCLTVCNSVSLIDVTPISMQFSANDPLFADLDGVRCFCPTCTHPICVQMTFVGSQCRQRMLFAREKNNRDTGMFSRRHQSAV